MTFATAVVIKKQCFLKRSIRFIFWFLLILLYFILCCFTSSTKMHQRLNRIRPGKQIHLRTIHHLIDGREAFQIPEQGLMATGHVQNVSKAALASAFAGVTTANANFAVDGHHCHLAHLFVQSLAGRIDQQHIIVVFSVVVVGLAIFIYMYIDIVSHRFKILIVICSTPTAAAPFAGFFFGPPTGVSLSNFDQILQRVPRDICFAGTDQSRV